MEQTPSQYRFRGLWQVHEFVFSWNLVCAVGNALLIYMFRALHSWVPRNDAYYYFGRAEARICDLLHLPLTTAVTTNAVARQEQGRWRWVGDELAVLISAVCATVIVLLLLRLVAKHRGGGVSNRFSIFCSLFSAPMCYVFISAVTRGWVAPGESQSSLFSWSALSIVLLGELIGSVVILLLRQYRPLPVPILIGLCVLHLAIWFPALWGGLPDISGGTIGAHLLLIGFPLSAVTSLLFLKPFNAQAERTVRPGGWVCSMGIGLITVAALCALWLPGWDYGLSRPRDIESSAIELSRGPCYGTCPEYRIVIHGTGIVEYVGRRYVNVHGRETSTVNSEVYTRLLKKLKDIGFFAMEDRAFHWGFDTPSVSVSVSIDGRFKRIVSDAGFTGTKSGVQDRFVRAVEDIEAIIGSDRWVRCPGRCRS